MSDIVICRQPFHFNGAFVKRGTTVRVGHPLLEGGRDQYFRPLVVDYDIEAPAPEPVVEPEPTRPVRPTRKSKE